MINNLKIEALASGRKEFLIPCRKNLAGLISNQKHECYSPSRLWKTNPSWFYASLRHSITRNLLCARSIEKTKLQTHRLLISWLACDCSWLRDVTIIVLDLDVEINNVAIPGVYVPPIIICNGNYCRTSCSTRNGEREKSWLFIADQWIFCVI